MCFIKQKTAYEMRISDWSSDVCSSDLVPGGEVQGEAARRGHAVGRVRRTHRQREAAEHRRASGREHRRLRQRLAEAVAVEVPDDADALFVGTAEAAVFAVVAFQPLGHVGPGTARYSQTTV